MSSKDKFVADLFTKPIVISPNEKQRDEALSLKILGGLALIIGIFSIIYAFISIGNYNYYTKPDYSLGYILIIGGFGLGSYGLITIKNGYEIARINFTGYIDEISPYQFEMLVEDLYSKQNYKCTNLKRSGDKGADIIAIKDDIKHAIQVKHYGVNHKVGNRVVRDVYGAIKMYDANEGIIVTTSYFTKPAIEAAYKTGIILIDRKKLKQMIYETYYKNSR